MFDHNLERLEALVNRLEAVEIMATLQELNDASARLEAATTALEALVANAPAPGISEADLQPIVDGLNNAANQAELAATPVAPAQPTPVDEPAA